MFISVVLLASFFFFFSELSLFMLIDYENNKQTTLFMVNFIVWNKLKSILQVSATHVCLLTNYIEKFALHLIMKIKFCFSDFLPFLCVLKLHILQAKKSGGDFFFFLATISYTQHPQTPNNVQFRYLILIKLLTLLIRMF